jgi:hypothetical protein
MIRCNQIALTMVQRQANLTAVLNTCPKPAKPGDDPPPCPVYEAAAAQNDSINRSSMTCNKYANGQYIPFFAAPKATLKGKSSQLGVIHVQWDRDEECTLLRAWLVDGQGQTLESFGNSPGFSKGYSGGNCVSNDSLPSAIFGEGKTSDFSVKPGSYRLKIFYQSQGGGCLNLDWCRNEPSWDTDVAVSADETVTVTPPRQFIIFRHASSGNVEPLNYWSIWSKKTTDPGRAPEYVCCLARQYEGIGSPEITWGPIAPGNYDFQFKYDPPYGRGRPRTTSRSVSVGAGESVTIEWP